MKAFVTTVFLFLSVQSISGLVYSSAKASSVASASSDASESAHLKVSPLIIHVSEFGVGKFHRADNKSHAYSAKSAWFPFILPDNASMDKPLILKNADSSYTVFFSTLDEMMSSIMQISKTENRKVSVLNIHGHGLPGAMWFPKDAAALNGVGCYDWQQAASGSDEANMRQYYSEIPASEIKQIRQMANGSGFSMPCTVGLKEWTAAVQKTPAFKTILDTDAQMHFLSCVVGLGKVGDNFTKGMAALLLGNGKGKIETSINFGLGDWSMDDGMGFWDYITDSQLNHDNSIYPVDRKDSEIAQKGSIRLAMLSSSGGAGAAWGTSVLADQSFLPLSFDSLQKGATVVESQSTRAEDMPSQVRIPGTGAYVELMRE